MKRSIAVLILALALALTACGGQKAADAQAEAKNITLCPTYDNGKGGVFFPSRCPPAGAIIT
mgnify:CR=1 FL=1